MRARVPQEERTSFQEAGPCDPRLHAPADVAMVYGLDDTFEERLAAWRQAGYRPHVMTGVSWGAYQAYVRGEWDGRPHYEDAQTAAGGFRLEHGVAQGHDCFYMMPSRTYARYLLELLRRVVEAGAVALHLEEPEFWVRAGYGEGFRREWREFYGEEWQDPASSPDARYRAEKLKQYLYTRTLEFLCRELKAYARQRGMADFRCYVPTHSLLNYSHWRIVSPESRLLALDECDGLIGQVWTGTSRTPTVYRGVRRQRTFAVGCCEYAACAALVRNSSKRLWQLADPIEDNPNYCWEDYRQNWECTVVASLLVPESERFEIMPWPRRIFLGTYPTVNLVDQPLRPLLEKYLARLERIGHWQLLEDTRRAFALLLDFYVRQGEVARRETLGFADLAESVPEIRFGDLWSALHGFYAELSSWPDPGEAQRLRDAVAAFYHDPTEDRSPIPAAYATELQVVFNALADMHWPGQTEWIWGEPGVAVGIADAMMFQRGEPAPSDPDLSSYYGLSLPLLMHGIAPAVVQLERTPEPGYLADMRLLLLTYEGQKPPAEEIHQALAAWVRQGGALLLFGQGDEYDSVREWWNQGGRTYRRPQEDLGEKLSLGRNPGAGIYPCGRGWVVVDPTSPAALARRDEGAAQVMSRVRQAFAALGLPLVERPYLALRRGPYVAAAGLEEADDPRPAALVGLFADLFDPALAVVRDPVVAPGSRRLLCDLERCPEGAWVVAAAGRVQDERVDGQRLRFGVEGMEGTEGVARVRLPAAPQAVYLDGATIPWKWETEGRTAFFRFPNQACGVHLEVRW